MDSLLPTTLARIWWGFTRNLRAACGRQNHHGRDGFTYCRTIGFNKGCFGAQVLKVATARKKAPIALPASAVERSYRPSALRVANRTDNSVAGSCIPC